MISSIAFLFLVFYKNQVVSTDEMYSLWIQFALAFKTFILHV